MAAAVHPGGAAVAYAVFASPASTLYFARSKLDGTCSFIAGTAIAPNITMTSTADMAYGASGFAVVWGEGTPVKLRRRVFGVNFCD
jgi:hypothetical protein